MYAPTIPQSKSEVESRQAIDGFLKFSCDEGYSLRARGRQHFWLGGQWQSVFDSQRGQNRFLAEPFPVKEFLQIVDEFFHAAETSARLQVIPIR